jgi:PKHD-type hydroxylase
MIYPIPPVNTFGKDHSAYWEGFLTDAELNYLINVNNWSNAAPAQIGSDNNITTNQNIRSTKISWLEPSNENKDIWNKLAKVIAEVNSRYFHFDLTGFYEPIQLGVYTAEDNGHYDWHIDAFTGNKSTPRKLSMVLMLSDPSDFEGGELLLKSNNDNYTSLNMVKGRAWFFPSYMLHKVTPVTRGTRKTIVLWVGGPAFK